MQVLQTNKIVQVTAPGAIVDNASLVTNVIDTKGFNEVAIYLMLGALDIAMTALKLQESDQSGSGFQDIPAADFSVGNELPSATADNTNYAWFVTMLGRKRFLKVVATCGDGSAGTYATAFALLGKASQSPNSATKRGVAKERIL